MHFLAALWPVLLALFLLLDAPAPACAFFRRVPNLDGRFVGQVLDFTANHGADRRLWSEALQEKRDLYVYLPPGFDPSKRYPVIFLLHGFQQDEKAILENGLPEIDAAMAKGWFPPAIVAIPDGSLWRPGPLLPNSGFLNTKAGRFEDYLFQDVHGFLCENFPLRPERGARVLAGVSLGGGAAFHHAIERRCDFGVVIGIFPPLNPRWVNHHGRYFANFDPESWGWRVHHHLGLRPVGRFFGGLVTIRMRRLVQPLYGSGNQVIEQMSRDNPIELLDRHDVRDGELQMLVAYAGRDQFNVDAQVESFLFRARERGVRVDVLYDPKGRHDVATALRFLPPVLDWLALRLEPYRVR